MVLQDIVNGLVLGSIFALVASGLTLKFGTLNVPNFAHGTLYMFGAYIAYTMVVQGIPFPIALIASMGSTALLGVIVEKVAFRPIRNAEHALLFITAVAIYIIMEQSATIAYGVQPRSIPIGIPLPRVEIPGVLIVPESRVLVLLTTMSLTAGLYVLVNKTKMGKTIRAVAQNRVAASLMGINIDQVASQVFAIGSAMAALAGILMGITFFMEPTMGSIILTVFVIIVFGGMGSIPGALLSAYIVGLTHSFVTSYVGAVFADGAVFLILMVILAVRPSGLFGVKER